MLSNYEKIEQKLMLNTKRRELTTVRNLISDLHATNKLSKKEVVQLNRLIDLLFD